MGFIGQIYAITAFIAFNVWAVKLFNRTADNIDANKTDEQKKIQFEKDLEKCIKELDLFFERLNLLEYGLVKRFYDENKRVISICGNELNTFNFLLAKGFQCRLNQYIDCLQLEISESSFNLLKLYFNSKK